MSATSITTPADVSLLADDVETDLRASVRGVLDRHSITCL